MSKKGIFIVVSGPAGSGKGTVVQLVRRLMPDVKLSVSATTRQPRPGEENGVHYYFMSRDEFEESIAHGDILEYTMYCGNYYGTPRIEAQRIVENGMDMMLEIEVEGAAQVKKLYPDAVTIMLIPPDAATLEARLRGRGTETDEVILRRLARAREELSTLDSYDYVVVNENNRENECAEAICRIISAEHSKTRRMNYVTDTFFNK